ncbi:unnamed protein product [Amoebophrya sp. A120]|nr:unnamed protein product [Amoebophrya sp. A120]|eukprot:GSA120T00009758001.1
MSMTCFYHHHDADLYGLDGKNTPLFPGDLDQLDNNLYGAEPGASSPAAVPLTYPVPPSDVFSTKTKTPLMNGSGSGNTTSTASGANDDAIAAPFSTSAKKAKKLLGSSKLYNLMFGGRGDEAASSSSTAANKNKNLGEMDYKSNPAPFREYFLNILGSSGLNEKISSDGNSESNTGTAGLLNAYEVLMQKDSTASSSAGGATSGQTSAASASSSVAANNLDTIADYNQLPQKKDLFWLDLKPKNSIPTGGGGGGVTVAQESNKSVDHVETSKKAENVEQPEDRGFLLRAILPASNKVKQRLEELELERFLDLNLQKQKGLGSYAYKDVFNVRGWNFSKVGPGYSKTVDGSVTGSSGKQLVERIRNENEVDFLNVKKKDWEEENGKQLLFPEMHSKHL